MKKFSLVAVDRFTKDQILPSYS